MPKEHLSQRHKMLLMGAELTANLREIIHSHSNRIVNTV
uniref:Uncharacterized protein n=1 Tax=Anguilla anguilla TaxID=7936 RepID=A0A0E9SCX8_ANGAN